LRAALRSLRVVAPGRLLLSNNLVGNLTDAQILPTGAVLSRVWRGAANRLIGVDRLKRGRRRPDMLLFPNAVINISTTSRQLSGLTPAAVPADQASDGDRQPTAGFVFWSDPSACCRNVIDPGAASSRPTSLDPSNRRITLELRHRRAA
jgi:hypothetical protein